MYLCLCVRHSFYDARRLQFEGKAYIEFLGSHPYNTSWDGDNNVTKDCYTSSFKCRQPTLLFSPSLSEYSICGLQGVLPVLGQGISIRYRVASRPN